MNKVLLILATAVLLNSIHASIQIKPHGNDKSLSRTTIDLVSAFNQCLVFFFDWAHGNVYDSLTSTQYFTFYSASITCALVVNMVTQYGNSSAVNPSLANDPLKPHLLFTKYVTILINLYSSAATSTNLHEGPATNFIGEVIFNYNVPFNYVLLFMSKERFAAVNNVAMFSNCAAASSPAVYILTLDATDVYVIGLAHVLQSSPYLFRVSILQEANIQQLHGTIHKDLQQVMIRIWSKDSYSLCKFGSPVLLEPNDCAVNLLIEKFNMTPCNVFYFPCESPRISLMYTGSRLLVDKRLVRTMKINVEFVSYLAFNEEHSFNCVFKTGKMGFMAFVQAFHPSTWIATTVACICLAVTIATMSTKKASYWWTRLQQSAVVVLMLLIDRFQARSTLKRAASRQAAVVITLWAFGAMLLSMSYSGNMISRLASPSLPPVPHGMHELSLVEYPILTTSSIKLYERPETEGYLHYRISDYFENNPGHNGTLAYYLMRLSIAMNFVNNSDMPGQIDSGESFKVLFAIADSNSRVKAAEIRNVINGSHFRASPAINLPFFIRRMLLAVENNSLFPIFQKVLANMREPGVWKYWEECFKHEELKQLIFSGYLLHNKTTLAKIWVNRINLATIWRNFGPLLDGSTSWHPVALDNMMPAFQLLGICLLLSAVLMLYERWPLCTAVRIRNPIKFVNPFTHTCTFPPKAKVTLKAYENATAE